MSSKQSSVLKVRLVSLSLDDFMADMSALQYSAASLLFRFINCFSWPARRKGWREDGYFLYLAPDRDITSNQHSIIQASMTGWLGLAGFRFLACIMYVPRVDLTNKEKEIKFYKF